MNECDGNVNIGIVVKQGSLQKQVVVVFSTTKNGDSGKGNINIPFGHYSYTFVLQWSTSTNM